MDNDEKQLKPLQLLQKKLSEKTLTPETFDFIFSHSNNKTDIALEILKTLKQQNYSQEDKENLLKITAEKLFKDMSIDEPAYSHYLIYLINHSEAYPEFIASLPITSDLKYMSLDEDYLDEINLETLFSKTTKGVNLAFEKNLLDEIKEMLGYSFVHRMKERKTPINQSQFNLIAPILYEKYLHKIYEIIFIGQSKEKKNEIHQEALFEGQVIYNNNQYLTSKRYSKRFSEGNPLFLDEKQTIPIGYNIHLPQGKTEGIIVEVYGGSSKDGDAYNPGVLSNTHNYLLKRGIAVITLNLPDLLKLEVHQSEMPESLYLEIQACIKKFYDTLKHNPNKLHEDLKFLNNENLKMYLMGESFGGGMAVAHAELFNTSDSFDGYISHDGTVNATMMLKSDIPIASKSARDFTADHLHFEKEESLNKINKSVLLLQNRDDNNVNMKTATDFYKKMIQSSKADLIRLFFTDVGNAATSIDEMHNKGHFPSTNKNDFIAYCEAILNFIKNGPSALPEFTELEGYRQDKLANKFYQSGTLQQKFVAESVEIFEKTLSEVEMLTPSMVNNANIAKQIDSEWEKKYKPLYFAMYQAKNLAINTHKTQHSGIPHRTALQNEVKRLKSSDLLTDEVIIKTLQSQEKTFIPLIQELFYVKLDSSVRISEIFSHPDLIEKFREILDSLPKDHDDAFVHYFLASLYKANPSLVEPLYPTFEGNPELTRDLNKAKEKLSKTLSKGQSLLLAAYSAQSKLAQDNLIEKKSLPSNSTNLKKK